MATYKQSPISLPGMKGINRKNPLHYQKGQRKNRYFFTITQSRSAHGSHYDACKTEFFFYVLAF